MIAIDPAVRWLTRGLVSLVFAVAAAHKWRDVARFGAAIDAYELLPPIWTVPAGAALIAAETGVAVGLWIPEIAPVAGIAAAVLLSLYAGAIAVNLARGRRDIDCGCAGPARRQLISRGLVVRNAVLALLALASALPAAPRALGAIDVVTVIAGAGTLSLLYAAVDGVIANAPQSTALRQRHVMDTTPDHGGAVILDG